MSVYVSFSCNHHLFVPKADQAKERCLNRFECSGPDLNSTSEADVLRRDEGWLCKTFYVDGDLRRVDFCPEHAPLYRDRSE